MVDNGILWIFVLIVHLYVFKRYLVG